MDFITTKTKCITQNCDKLIEGEFWCSVKCKDKFHRDNWNKHNCEYRVVQDNLKRIEEERCSKCGK